ncbi:MAG: hypothetical protein ACE5EC_05700, partial [Phycisphaerae bacterium]
MPRSTVPSNIGGCIRSMCTSGMILAVVGSSQPAGAQVQAVVGPRVRIDTGGGTFAANETTVSASEADPDVVIAGWNDWRRSGASEVN